MGDETSFSRLFISDPEAGVPEQTHVLKLSFVVKQKGFSGVAQSSNIPLSSLGAATPSGYYNFKIVQAVSREGQCLCGQPANMVNSNLS